MRGFALGSDAQAQTCGGAIPNFPGRSSKCTPGGEAAPAIPRRLRGATDFRLLRHVAVSLLLAALWCGLGVSPAQAQLPPVSEQGEWAEGGNGDVEVEVLSTPAEVARTGVFRYQIRLTEAPLADVKEGNWWVRVHVNGGVRADGYLPPGEFEDRAVDWVPSVGWEFNRSNYNQWRTITFTIHKEMDTPLTINHEVWGSSEWCPRHPEDYDPLIVNRIANNPATGRPAIGGTAQVGQTLTANRGNIADPDGLTKANASQAGYAYAYRWIRVDGSDETLIAGAISSTYAPVEEDVGHSLRVRAEFTDDLGFAESRTSLDTQPVAEAPPPTVRLTLTPSSVSENGGQSTVTATVTPASATAFTVTVSAAPDGEFTRSSNTTLSFAANATASTGTVTLTAVNNTLDEAGRTVRVSGTAAGNPDVVVTGATLTITDDDESPWLNIEDASGPEDVGTLEFRVTLDVESGMPVTVAYASADGTAVAGQDYTSTSGTLTFAAGETEQTLSVTILDDSDREDDETFSVNLSPPTNAELTDGEATGTIEANDPEEPGPPKNLEASADGQSQIDLRWDPPDDDGGSEITGYKIEWSADDGDPWTTLEASHGSTTYSDTGLEPETTRYYRVSAINDIGEGPPSDSDGATTDAVDGSRVTLVLTPSSVSEDRGQSTVTATVSPTQATAFTVTVSAAPNGEFTLSPNATLSFTANASASTGTVTLTAVDNALDEDDRTVPVSGTAAGSPDVEVNDATLTITDDDESPRLSIEDASGPEDVGTLEFRVTLDVESGMPVTVAYTTADDTAIAGQDYASTSGTLTFAPGQAEQTLSVTILDDSDREDDETFSVNLSPPTNAELTDGEAKGTIEANDPEEPGPPKNLEATAAGQTQIDLRWDPPDDAGGSEITGYLIEWSADDGDPWTTLEASHGSTTYSDTGLEPETTRYYRVSAINDVGEGPPSDSDGATTDAADVPRVTLLLNPSSVSENGGQSTVTATVSPTLGTAFSVTVSSAPNGEFTRSTNATLSFTANASASTGTVTLTAVDNALDEADRTVRVSGTAAGSPDVEVSPATLTIADDDDPPRLSIEDASGAEDIGTLEFRVTLNRHSGKTVTVAYSTADGTATAGRDYTSTSGTLTFEPGQTERTLSVTILDDVDREDDESFAVNLSGPSGATVSDGSATGTIEANDPEEPGAPKNLEATAVGQTQIDLRWEPPDDDGGSEITGYRIEGSADDGDPWTTLVAHHPTTTYSDTGLEPETTRYYRVSAINAVGEGPPSDSAGATTDAADVSRVTLRLNPSSVSENDGQSTVTATVSPASATAFTVTVSPAPDGEFALSSNATLSFAANAVSSTVTVTLTAVDNALDEPDRTVRVSGTAAGDSDVAVTGAILTITDDDGLPGLSIEDASGEEDAGTLEFRVTLDSESAKRVTVAYATADGTATAGEDYTSTSGTLTLAAGETSGTIEVEVHDDSVLEGSETLSVGLSAATNATLSDASATGTIQDDERLSSLSVDDAQAFEDAGALEFTVNLEPASRLPVTVDWATADGTATAGEDYTQASGTLTLAAGVTRGTIEVEVHDDTAFEGSETLSVGLSGPTNATLQDDRATGTILEQTADLGKTVAGEWLSRFGRSVATHVVDAVGDRLTETSEPESHLTVSGLRLRTAKSASPSDAPPTTPEAEEFGEWVSWPGPAEGRDESGSPAFPSGPGGSNQFAPARAEPGWSDPGRSRMHRLLSRSSFRWSSANGGPGSSTGWTAWGRGTAMQFDGREGEISLDGDVMTTTLGADYTRGRTIAGVAVAHSYGEGEFSAPETEGEVESSLVSVHPYLGITRGRLSTWGMLGYGRGHMNLRQDHGRLRARADIDMRLGALGVRGELLSVGGLDWAVKSDAFWVEMDADSEPGLSVEDADASRWRLLLEGSGRIGLDSGAVLEPSVELGLRRDGGEAETGSGFEMGGAMRYTDSARGLAVELNARRLMTHAEREYEEWGVGGSIRVAPDASGLGPGAEPEFDVGRGGERTVEPVVRSEHGRTGGRGLAGSDRPSGCRTELRAGRAGPKGNPDSVRPARAVGETGPGLPARQSSRFGTVHAAERGRGPAREGCVARLPAFPGV